MHKFFSDHIKFIKHSFSYHSGGFYAYLWIKTKRSNQYLHLSQSGMPHRYRIWLQDQLPFCPCPARARQILLSLWQRWIHHSLGMHLPDRRRYHPGKDRWRKVSVRKLKSGLCQGLLFIIFCLKQYKYPPLWESFYYL